MSTDIVPANGHGMTVADTISVAQHLAQSGYFRDASDVSKAVAKILYGQALGIAPVQSMMGVDIIEGKPAPSAGLVAALVKRSGRYDYRVVDADADPVVIEWIDRGKVIGRSSFGTEDAKRAGLAGKPNYQRWPKAMRFSRALTSGARMYAPDVFLGPVYTPDELDEGMPVDAGEVIDASPRPAPVVAAEPPPATNGHTSPPPAKPAKARKQTPASAPAGHGPEYWVRQYERCTAPGHIAVVNRCIEADAPDLAGHPDVAAARTRAAGEIAAALADFDDLTPDDALAAVADAEARAHAEADRDREVIEGFVAAAQAEVA